METDTRTTPRRRPQDLVFTLFGDYLLHRAGWVWVGSLIALLRPLGLSAGATRTVLSRMSRKGWLATRREGRRAYYRLTERGRELLEEGEARIYRPPREQGWDGLWYLVAYSVPEERRGLRDRLRLRLQWLGFGQLGNGLWLSPHPVGREVERVTEELGVSEHVELFRAHYQGTSSIAHLVEEAWDLPDLAARYVDFIARYEPEYARCGAAAPGGEVGEECYVRRFELIHEYREFPQLDPYLPPRLLPAEWPGGRAAELFESYHDLLTARAERYLESVLEVLEEPREGMASRGA